MRICWRPVGVLLVTLVLGIGPASYFYDARLFAGELPVVGYGLIAVGLLVVLVNVYLSFLRPMIDDRLAREPRFASGIPFIGMVSLVGLAFVPPSGVVASIVTAATLMDTGNLLWFVVGTWRDDSLWCSNLGRSL